MRPNLVQHPASTAVRQIFPWKSQTGHEGIAYPLASTGIRSLNGGGGGGLHWATTNGYWYIYPIWFNAAKSLTLVKSSPVFISQQDGGRQPMKTILSFTWELSPAVLTWVDAEGVLDGRAPHTCDSACHSMHVREELHGTQWILWDRAIARVIVGVVALRKGTEKEGSVEEACWTRSKRPPNAATHSTHSG